jgi:hypothetical protein
MKASNVTNKTNYQLRQLAETLGLAVTGGGPMFPKVEFLGFLKQPLRLEGRHRGIHLQVYHYTVRSGESSTTYATVRAKIENDKDLEFKFSKEGFFSRIGKSLGMQDVSTGDERFDRLFILKCSDPEFMTPALLPQVKEKFFETWETHEAPGSISLKKRCPVLR